MIVCCRVCGASSLRSVVLLNRAATRPRLSSRRSLSSSSQDESSSFRFPLNYASLGLEQRLVYPYLESIQQLPEIQTALQDVTASASVENLKRGIQVFEMMQKGGNEHLAVLALLAEITNRQGQYDQVYNTLVDKIQPSSLASSSDDLDSAATSLELSLARAKTLWHMGEFEQVESCCEALLDRDEINDLPLHYASAMTGVALARLGLCQTLDDAFVVRDPFRMVVKFLERHPHYGSLPLATAQLNYGVSEAVFAHVVGNINDVTVPMDPALKAWNTAISILEQSGLQSTTAISLQGRLQSNMAWGVLQVEGMQDNLKRASEFGGKALSYYDKNEEEQDHLCRILTIVADCYLRAEQAVTAEGLYQSAVDDNKHTGRKNVLIQLQRRDACRAYAKLCQQWEKRQADANQLEDKATSIEESLPDQWKGKLGIYSSLWFWTPSVFL